MAVKLSSDQQKTVREVLASADRNGATPMERLAAIMTIGVEANYKSVDYGDRDSLGAFQQRASWGDAKSRLNAGESADRFFKVAKQMRQARKFSNAGDLAAAVQRPAAQYAGRYADKRGEALQVLQQYGGEGGGGTSLASDLNAPSASGVQGTSQEFDADRGAVSMLAIQRPVMPTATAPAAPAVSAGPAMPAGAPAQGAAAASPYQAQGVPSSGAPQAPAPLDVGDGTLPDYTTSFGDDQPAGQASVQQSDTGSDTGAPAGKPSVKIAAGANAAGKPLAKPLVNFLDGFSAASGRELTVTTGTNHSRLTVNGNVSEHSVGRGADLAMKGQQLTDTGTDALLYSGKGKTIQWLKNDGSVVNVRLTAANARKLAEAGGIFNVPTESGGRVQVILNTHQGGDHTNHLHIGFRDGES